MTAAVGLYKVLGLPHPWTPVKQPTPLLVYGAASAVGAFVIKLARLSNIHPIIGVVGRGAEFAESLIDRSKGDTLVDYRKGDDALVQDLKQVLSKLGYDGFPYVYDAISELGAPEIVAKVTQENGVVTPVWRYTKEQIQAFPDGVKVKWTGVGWSHRHDWPDEENRDDIDPIIGGKDASYVFLRFMARGLAEGWFTPHPYEVVEGGLEGVEKGLLDLKAGKASGKKFVFRFSDEQ